METQKQRKKARKRTLKQLILKITKRFPDTKTSYQALVMMTWIWLGFKRKAIRVSDKGVWIDLDGVRQLPSSESITRCFRKLVEEGLIQLPPEEIKRRRRAEEWFREEYGRKIFLPEEEWEEFP